MTPSAVTPPIMVDGPTRPGDDKTWVQGTHRTVSPEETWERWAPHMRHFGVTRVADITDLDCVGVPVAQAVRPNSRNLSVSQGKGLTLAAARVSALMEAIELHHAESHRCEVIEASADDFIRDGTPFVLLGLPRYGQVAPDRSRRNTWVFAEPLNGSSPVAVPEAFVSMDFRAPLDPMTATLVCSSNGLASGNTRDEATLHGLCEVIERDACHNHRGTRCCLNPEARLRFPTNGDLANLREQCDIAGVDIALADATSEFGVPVIACVAVDRQAALARNLGAAMGYGCHPDAEIAACRAVTEALQSRLTTIAASRDDHIDSVYASTNRQRAFTWARSVIDTAPRRDLDSVSSCHSPTISSDIETIRQRLATHQFDQVLVVDLTRDDTGFPAVKVIVPGLADVPCAARP